MPRVSVVMPYYENHRTLLACLASFTQQSYAATEIIVVDDGATHPAATLVAGCAWPVPVHVQRQAHAGQSAATNAGIEAARGDLIVLTCADIIAHPELLAVHAHTHASRAEPCGVIGALPYADCVPKTLFMQYLALPGPQFSFAEITDPDNVAPEYCYAPNVSVARTHLQRIGGFDSQFVYGFGDTDLGKRLVSAGIRLLYRAAAIGYHDHPNTARNFVRRQRLVGKAAWRYLDKHPNAAQLAKAQAIVQQCWQLVPQLDGLLDNIEGLERRLQQSPALIEPLRPQLHKLYTMALTIALVEGMLSEPVRLREVLGVHMPLPTTTPC